MTSSDEFVRQSRVIDLMITAHCGLRDRYDRLALWQDVLTLTLSIGLLATTFVDPAIVGTLGVSQEAARIVLGIAAIGVFTTTVIELRVRWRERSGAHRVVAKALGELKLSGRGIDPIASPGEADEWLQDARRLLKGVPEIPERQFLRLKARHVRKIEVSKMISRRPGAWLPVIRLAVWWRGTFGGGTPGGSR